MSRRIKNGKRVLVFNLEKSALSFSNRVNGTVAPQGKKFTVTFKPTPGYKPQIQYNEGPAIRPDGMEGPEFDDYAWTADDY